MTEKIIKTVKSSNKKRGRNITVGAVVGFLLSCTAVIGADDYLWIKEDSGEIKFSTDNGISLDTDNPYGENTWNGTNYINNITLFGTNNLNDSEGYGLKLSGDLNSLSFINNGSIIGEGKGSTGYGISNTDRSNIVILTNSGLITGRGYNDSYGIDNYGSTIGTLANSGLIIAGTGNELGYGISNFIDNDLNKSNIGTLTNSGLITGTGDDVEGYGIDNYGSSIETLTNNGSITGAGKNGYGISNNEDASIGTLTNNGLIIGAGENRSSYGIYNFLRSGIGTLTNSGLITGAGDEPGYGIYNTDSANIGTLTNTGIIYGSSSAVKSKISSGTITNAFNYGILVSGTANKVGDGISIVAFTSTPNNNEIANYGLAFVAIGSSYKTHDSSDADHNFGAAAIVAGMYTIRNVGASVSSGSITEVKSFGIKDGKLYFDASNIRSSEISDSKSTINNVILNGIEDTLKVIGTDEKNILNNSIINAYKTAINFDDIGGSFTLSGTTINGGVDGKSDTISGSGKADILILQNTTINGNIDMRDDNDILTIETGSILNGTLDGGNGNDTLNFGESGTAKTRAASSSDEIRILHDISGFENINVNSNVTFYEKTIDTAGTEKALEVTDVSNLTIGANGVLTLRIDSANSNAHALTGNSGTIKSANGGKLLLALNGVGNNSIISFGNLALDGSLVTEYEGKYQEDVTFATTSELHSVKRTSRPNEVEVAAKNNLPTKPIAPDDLAYEKLNKIYYSILSVDELGNFNVDNDEKLSTFLGYLNDIYAGNPYSYSSELSRKSTGMFREIVTENQFKANTGKWMIYGGLTHIDGGTKDTYYGKGYYTYDIGSSDMDADTKITGAYILGEYGVSDTLTSGVVIGGNKLKSDLSNGSKVDGSAMYLGAYAKKYIGNLKVTAGAGFQHGDYDADRLAINKVASSTGESIMKYSDNYNDMTYDIYLNGRYSHQVGDNLFLEPYATLSYTYVDQDGADEGNKTLAIETDSKSFDYTVGKVGVDLKKVIPHEKGKSTLSAGVSYTRILDGADEEYIIGRFKGGSDFDILVAHKNEHSIGLNAKYALELENGVIFDVKGTYSVERDSHNNSGKNKTKGEWIVGAGIGYKF